MKTKRFVVMGGAVYYASGGFEDYLNSFDTKEEADKFAADYLKSEGEYHWAQVGDLETGDFWVLGQPACNPMGILK